MELLTDFSGHLSLSDSEVAQLVDVTFPLLSDKLGQETQQVTLAFFQTLARSQPDTVWAMASRVTSVPKPAPPTEDFRKVEIPGALQLNDPSLVENATLVLSWCL